MNKLFLLPIFALIGILSVSSVLAVWVCCSSNSQGTACSWNQQSQGETCADVPAYNCATNCGPMPAEFTTIGAGIALIGAGVGYALIRRKRK